MRDRSGAERHMYNAFGPSIKSVDAERRFPADDRPLARWEGGKTASNKAQLHNRTATIASVQIRPSETERTREDI